MRSAPAARRARARLGVADGGAEVSRLAHRAMRAGKDECVGSHLTSAGPIPMEVRSMLICPVRRLVTHRNDVDRGQSMSCRTSGKALVARCELRLWNELRSPKPENEMIKRRRACKTHSHW